MSIWQYNAAIKGYVKANSSSDPKKFGSEEEKDEMFTWLLAQEVPKEQNLINKIYIFDGFNFNLERIVNFKIKG